MPIIWFENFYGSEILLLMLHAHSVCALKHVWRRFLTDLLWGYDESFSGFNIKLFKFGFHHIANSQNSSMWYIVFEQFTEN